MSKVIFETERLTVRQYTISDIDEFYLLNSDEEVMRYIRKTLSYDEAADFLQRNLDMYEQTPLLGRWAVHNRQHVYVGSFAIIPIGETTDIQLGYALLKPFWGQGYASELTAKGVEYAITNSIDPLYAQAEPANTGSHKVLLKNSFEHISEVMDGDKLLYRYRLRRS